MKKSVMLLLFFSLASITLAGSSAHVFLADGSTPLEYEEIMVGTKLTIIVDSNTPEEWAGCLVLEDDHRFRGVLSDRPDTCYPAAGFGAAAFPTDKYWSEIGKDVKGFDLYTGPFGISVGNWFILDYEATDIGDCDIGFYKHNPPSSSEFICYIEFTHVRTRDFDSSTKVDLSDFAILALHWQETGCEEPEWCEGTDLDTSGTVNEIDLMFFADYWLEETE